MKLNRNLFLTGLTLAALTAGAWAQTETASNITPENKSSGRCCSRRNRPGSADGDRR
jgi:hypothetical protein